MRHEILNGNAICCSQRLGFLIHYLRNPIRNPKILIPNHVQNRLFSFSSVHEFNCGRRSKYMHLVSSCSTGNIERSIDPIIVELRHSLLSNDFQDAPDVVFDALSAAKSSVSLIPVYGLLMFAIGIPLLNH